MLLRHQCNISPSYHQHIIIISPSNQHITISTSYHYVQNIPPLDSRSPPGLQSAAWCRTALQSFGEDHGSFETQLVALIRGMLVKFMISNIPSRWRKMMETCLARYSTLIFPGIIVAVGTSNPDSLGITHLELQYQLSCSWRNLACHPSYRKWFVTKE